MNDGLQFDEELVEAMERLYTQPSMIERRRLIRERLAVDRGQRVVSVGTGPGFEAEGLAEAVGPDGAVLGVDTEAPMLAVAGERCDAFPWVSFELGDATALPVDDGAVDAATAVQVLEYVPDLDAAFDELYRVVRPGGRVAVFDSDWHTLTWHAADPARSARIVEAFDAHCPHPRLARSIEPRLESSGFEVVDRAAHVHLDTDGKDGSIGAGLMHLLYDFVTENTDIDPATADAWVDDLTERAEVGEYFCSFNQYLFVGERPTDA